MPVCLCDRIPLPLPWEVFSHLGGAAVWRGALRMCVVWREFVAVCFEEGYFEGVCEAEMCLEVGGQ